jgi:hypothetical protein
MSGMVGIGKSPGINGGGTGVFDLLSARTKPGVKLDSCEVPDSAAAVVVVSAVSVDSVFSVKPRGESLA